jgi:hypothetical protein
LALTLIIGLGLAVIGTGATAAARMRGLIR